MVAERSPLRCGPVWRAIHYIFDAARICEQLQRYFILRSRRNHRPRRGERQHCPEGFDGDISAALSLNFSFLFSRLHLNRMRLKKTIAKSCQNIAKACNFTKKQSKFVEIFPKRFLSWGLKTLFASAGGG